MKITVNGQARLVPDGMILADLLLELTGATRGSAAAVNGEVVPRSEWSIFHLLDGHTVEVLTAVQGG